MHLLYPIAKRYIAGEDLATALDSISKLSGLGFQSSVDILGENTLVEAQAVQAKQQYLDLIGEVEQGSHVMDFSVKLSQMGSDIGEALCKKNIREILEASHRHTVRLDMEGSSSTQRTIDLCLDLHAAYKNLGIALQVYLHRNQADVQTMVDHGVSVRLCKGAYKESSDIAYQFIDDIREYFLKQAFLLLKEGVVPAIATHDEYLIQKILDFVIAEKVDPGSFFFELLYGVRRDLQKILLAKGFQVRIYVPYGKSWLPYTLRRLAERKENVIFVIKHLFSETLGLQKIK